MALNWIHVEDFSFNCFTLMERFELRLMGTYPKGELAEKLGVALRYNPAVHWYFTHKCPESADAFDALVAAAPENLSAEAVREAELFVMRAHEDFVTYTRPELMDTSCDFIYAWEKRRLFEMADFDGKIVLDVGSGSGRLAFAAAERAKLVIASEPVDTLREYLRDKIAREGIENVLVADGMAHALPYLDDTFDIVMSGHVVGDELEAEVAELTRVVKSGGWLLDCPGDEARKREPPDELAQSMGWEPMHYTGTLGGDVFRYRKQIFKTTP